MSATARRRPLLFFAGLFNPTFASYRMTVTPDELMSRVGMSWSVATRTVQPLFIALGGLVATLLSVLVASRIMRRLTAMAEAADDLRTGRKTGFEGPTGRDEAGRIGRSIASLVGTLQQANAELSASNERLDALAESLLFARLHLGSRSPRSRGSSSPTARSSRPSCRSPDPAPTTSRSAPSWRAPRCASP